MAQPSFAQHQPGMVVPGGHPMAHTHPSNQGIPGGGPQPVVSMGPQMHAGVAGPGGPQVSQAGPMMAGIMPNNGPAGMSGGPSAHAQAHLNPGQQQMFAQNPQMQMSKLRAHFVVVLLIRGAVELSNASRAVHALMHWERLRMIRMMRLRVISTPCFVRKLVLNHSLLWF